DGSWKTAALKEYPPGLCKALCCIVEAGQTNGPQEEDAEIPAVFLETIRELTRDFNFLAERGPDFHAPTA
ncbi:unnamed protein product, partial [Durusdinium trenchii]